MALALKLSVQLSSFLRAKLKPRPRIFTVIHCSSALVYNFSTLLLIFTTTMMMAQGAEKVALLPCDLQISRRQFTKGRQIRIPSNCKLTSLMVRKWVLSSTTVHYIFEKPERNHNATKRDYKFIFICSRLFLSTHRSRRPLGPLDRSCQRPKEEETLL